MGIRLTRGPGGWHPGPPVTTVGAGRWWRPFVVRTSARGRYRRGIDEEESCGRARTGGSACAACRGRGPGVAPDARAAVGDQRPARASAAEHARDDPGRVL